MPPRLAAPDATPAISSALARTIEYSRALVDALPEATVIVVGADETVWLAEGKLLERHGHAAGMLSGRALEDILPPSTRDTLIEHYLAALGGRRESFDYLTADGRTLCQVQLTPMYFGAQAPVAVTAVIQDMTERHRLACELQTERERRRMAEELARIAHLEIDLHTDVVICSEGALGMLGLEGQPRTTLAALMGRVDEADRPRLAATLAAVSESGHGECECDAHLPGGERRRLLIRGRWEQLPDGREVIIGAAIDITELRAAEQVRSESEALLRQGFDSSPIGMALSAPEGRYFRVNDALCRLLGRSREEMLALRPVDVTHPDDRAQEQAARERMAASPRGEFVAEKRYLRRDGTVVWASLHLVPVYGADGEIEACFSQVVDLTASKEREAQLIEDAADVERLAAVRSALSAKRLRLHAQPIFDLATGEVVQHELLVRLIREDGSLVPPGEFLPVAERHGCINEIDRWVTRRAIDLAARGVPVEVNLSGASVGDEETLATIREALAATGADPSLVVFEVTETALMADVERGRAFARAVRELGCRFALDDFGTGYGTFTYLKHIPIDFIKIDIEFVRDLAHSDADERIVRAMVKMAGDLGKKTVAEGVENAAALERLRELGVDHAQGFHLGRPGPMSL